MNYNNLDAILERTSDEVNKKIEHNIEGYLVEVLADYRWPSIAWEEKLEKIYKIFNNLLKNNFIKEEEFLNIDPYINFDGYSKSFIIRDNKIKDYIKIYTVWEDNKITKLDIKYNNKESGTMFELEREYILCELFFNNKNFNRFEQAFINIINNILNKRDALLNELENI